MIETHLVLSGIYDTSFSPEIPIYQSMLLEVTH